MVKRRLLLTFCPFYILGHQIKEHKKFHNLKKIYCKKLYILFVPRPGWVSWCWFNSVRARTLSACCASSPSSQDLPQQIVVNREPYLDLLSRGVGCGYLVVRNCSLLLEGELGYDFRNSDKIRGSQIQGLPLFKRKLNKIQAKFSYTLTSLW